MDPILWIQSSGSNPLNPTWYMIVMLLNMSAAYERVDHRRQERVVAVRAQPGDQDHPVHPLSPGQDHFKTVMYICSNRLGTTTCC
jgi:hypothetical protein